MGFFSNIFSRSTKKKRKKRKKKAKRARREGTGRAKAFLWWLIGLCTALIFIMVFVLSDHGLYQLWQLKQEQAVIEQHIKELEKENAELVTERNRLRDDLEYIEKLARERYRMAEEGEKVFRVIPKTSQNKSE
ncbi:MAG: septum formation initiator family protein [Candidatus Marinimicrobia bacterium]|nr:septum formation initiator family protein [Candidatus Neomarinimicrobiota bacterium]MCF7828856.1 septum formation initiator family protein [Candidatus Neomarinimicrobiota bacterium]MCF7880773.1 septum formation initiator family protein [Candidatus Neomarinimicrobiota bacterium]